MRRRYRPYRNSKTRHRAQNFSALKSAAVNLIFAFAAAALLLFGTKNGHLQTAFALLIIAAGILFLLFAVIKVVRDKREETDCDFSFKVYKTLLKHFAEGEKCGVYVCDKLDRCVYNIKNGKEPYEGEKCRNFAEYISQARSVEADSVRRLKNAFALVGRDESLKLDITEKEGIFEYTLTCVRYGSGDRYAVVCTCTKKKPVLTDTENESVTDKEQVLAGKNTSCIEVFLEKNNWRFIWNSEGEFEKLGFGTELQMNYDKQLKNMIAPIVTSKDRARFLKELDRLALLEKFRNGTGEAAVVYRISTPEREKARVLDVRMYRDKISDEVKAQFYVRSFDADSK